MCKRFFPYCLLYGPCIMCVHFVSNYFVLSLQNFEKYLVVVLLYYVCVLLLCSFCIYLYVMYLYDLLHILLLPLKTQGSMECIYVQCTKICSMPTITHITPNTESHLD